MSAFLQHFDSVICFKIMFRGPCIQCVWLVKLPPHVRNSDVSLYTEQCLLMYRNTNETEIKFLMEYKLEDHI